MKSGPFKKVEKEHECTQYKQKNYTCNFGFEVIRSKNSNGVGDDACYFGNTKPNGRTGW